MNDADVDNVELRVVDSLKDYAVKAFVNTVDHLGTVSCKVDGFLCEKVDEVYGAELRVTSIEQVMTMMHMIMMIMVVFYLVLSIIDTDIYHSFSRS